MSDHVSYPPSLLLVRRPEALPDAVQPDIEKRLGGLPEVFVLSQFGDPDHLEQTPLPQLLGWLSGRREAFRLVLLGFEESEALPQWLIIALANSPVTAIDRLIFLDRSAPPLILPHRPYRYAQVQTLSVFPGLMIPLSMGSHQRAFLLAMHMAKEGCPVDFLITGDKKNFPRARAVLSQIGRQVHYYGNKRPKLPRLMRLRRQCEKLWRKINGVSGVGPDLFAERLSNKANFSGKKKLRNLIEAYPYRNVIINYAWLEPIRDMVPASLKRSVRWYCDTHDVQFVRGQTANVGEIRFLVSSRRERKIEIDVLSRFDRLIAISASDAAVLEGVFPDGRVIRSPTGFDYAFGCPNPAPGDAPVFGFIGGRMDANVRALLFVLNEWWPAIVRRWPAAVLSIAGAVSTDPHVVAATRSDARVVREGFVPSLQLWYAQIDCVLNPVIVQGGLNFKSVEAIFAGKVLITNAQGAVCINDDRVLEICNSARDVVEKLESMWAQGVSEFRKDIEFRQAAAKEQFGDAQAYAQLVREIDSGVQTQPFLDARSPQTGGRVLIQCGDHFENRQRILGLAREVLRRGYLPVVLVYSREHVMPFLCQGVDAIALDEFSESWLQRVQRKARILSVRSLAMKYRELDIDDLTLTDQMHRPNAYRGRRFRGRLNDISRQVDRMLRVIDKVRPQFICVWNGYTGLTANILRQHAVQHDIGRLFMERSLFRHGVFVDPLGVNGFSSLAVFPKWNGPRPAEAVDVRERKHRPTNLVELERLRQLPKWRSARRIIFIPLQVESDTNLLLHSSEIKSMYELVEYVVNNIASIDDAVVVRPHPEEVSEVKIPDGANIYVDSEGTLDSWLEIADLVVTINSTVGLEALLTDTEVISLGRGVFTEFGLTSANPRRGGGIDVLRARMMDHSVARDGRRSRVLDAVIPEHTAPPTAVSPLNGRGVDFRSLGLRCKADALCVREAALKQGQLLFVSDLTEGESLDLTYRNTSIPWSAEWMAERLRDEFSLDAEVEVRLVRRDAPGEKALVRVIGEEGQTSSDDLFLIDKYGIPRCDDFPPTNSGMMAK